MRLSNFKELIEKYSDNELQIRNNVKLCQLFAEVISVLCLSRKKYGFKNLNLKIKVIIIF